MAVKEGVSGEMDQRWKGRYAVVQRVRGMRDDTGSVDLMFDYLSVLARQSDIPYSCPLLSVVHSHVHVSYDSQVE
jgi:hypothetical protein